MHAIIDPAQLRASSSALIHPVVLSGGAGTKLWPLSRAIYPKQLLPLTSERSLLQQTLARGLGDTGFAPPVIVCNEDHCFLIEEQARSLEIEPRQVLLEPVGRNTAPAIAAAALWLSAREPDALMLVQPSDHLIGSVPEFYQAVTSGVAAAQAGKLVAFGITPTRVDTSYGYIQAGAAFEGAAGAMTIDRFIDRPDLEAAQRYVKSGAFYWNSGIFLFAARHFLAELERLHAPIYRACRRAVEEGKEQGGIFRLDAAAFSDSPSLSVDRAVMEHTDRGVVVPVEMAWSDVGSWQSLRECGAPDEAGNVVHGDVMMAEVTNSYIHSEDKLVAAIGLDDVVVVVTDDAVLVSSGERSADVAAVVEQLRERNRSESDRHTTVRHPWGHYRTTDIGERFQVRRLVVKPGARLSLEKHYHRSEHWVVVEGTAIVQRGDENLLVHEGESIYIPVGMEHRLENPGKLPLHLVAVQSGAYFGEDEIVHP